MQGELTCGKSTSSRFIFLGASDSHGNGSLTQGKHPRLTLALCAAAAASFSLALEPSLRACQDMACSLMSTCACTGETLGFPPLCEFTRYITVYPQCKSRQFSRLDIRRPSSPSRCEHPSHARAQPVSGASQSCVGGAPVRHFTG
jgi:hypothetical protein